MRILVTGAGGYIGYAVARRLAAAGHEVDGLVRRAADLPRGVRAVTGDLLGALPPGPYDAVCHLAARTRVRESFDDPLAYYETNVGGTLALLRALGGGGAHVVFGSTAAVYGAPPEGRPIPETAATAPAGPYGATKLAAEQMIRQYARTGAIGATVLRTFNVSGSVDGRPDPDPTRLIPKALAVAAGRAPHLEINGDGLAVREYLHVDDLAAAYVRALEAAARPGEDRVYNVGTGTGTAVHEVVATVERVTGRPVPAHRRPAVPEPPELVCDAAAIRADLGWRASRALPELIADAWNALTRTND
ncbi:NAD-dependent epimerase/dehydratase family protein [Actinomadura sp. WMMB 499]|uniref:NAD-dependent epimerase/dehydratase family protein n=1 Tax=Actinomadura sp. WMMB 499 TaxID=1219491 RepID=UPI001244716D|nr:NAD-dependent epimerase/dehydratase family protein [Actinomadura sp. WMMB 499]QFG20586.1 UDP-glucose 4-epimerase [Actinomadura sp. WMMB 499]